MLSSLMKVLDGVKNSAYHPFYITDDCEGGYFQKTKAEKDASVCLMKV